MLIDHGAKIDGEDCRGHTPLDLAKLWGHRKCARLGFSFSKKLF
jgi:ankyrin repeat protein